MPKLVILESERFSKSFDRLGPGLENAAIGALGDLHRLSDSQPTSWIARYDRVEGFPNDVVLEIDIGGAERLLAHFAEGTLTLLEVGGHEVVNRYSRKKLDHDLINRAPARAAVSHIGKAPRGVFGDLPDTRSRPYDKEMSPEWLYYLTTYQVERMRKIREAIKRGQRQNPSRIAVLGGPGTGKTSLLLKILLDMRSTHKVKIVLSGPVRGFIAASLPALNLDDNAITYGEMITEDHEMDILLLDDPDRFESHVQDPFIGSVGSPLAVIAAFDPCQMGDDFTDGEYDEITRLDNFTEVQLKECYRQREVLGRATKRVMDYVERTSPFAKASRVEEFREDHKLVYRVANDMRFPNPHGYEKTYVGANELDVVQEIKRIRSSGLWKHTPPLLLVIDRMSPAAKLKWETILAGIKFKKILIKRWEYWQLKEVKGIEFQHAFLNIGHDLYDELTNGSAATGVGPKEYHGRRLLRIPWSRSKDSLVTFVWEVK